MLGPVLLLNPLDYERVGSKDRYVRMWVARRPDSQYRPHSRLELKLPFPRLFLLQVRLLNVHSTDAHVIITYDVVL